MASKTLSSTLRYTSRSPVSRNGYICTQCRYNSGDVAPAPPLLLKLKDDLKTAMRSKQKNRLDVIRSIMSEVNNATKSSTPIKTDMQLLSLLRKRTSAAQQASKEFKDAGRADLVEREDAQIAILNEYAGDVEIMGLDQVKDMVGKAVEEMKSAGSKLAMGDVSKKLLGPGGIFDGKPVERGEVIRIVKELLGQK